MERAHRDGVELTGDDGLLTALIQQVMQTGLEVEMTDHLGYETLAVEGATLEIRAWWRSIAPSATRGPEAPVPVTATRSTSKELDVAEAEVPVGERWGTLIG